MSNEVHWFQTAIQWLCGSQLEGLPDAVATRLSLADGAEIESLIEVVGVQVEAGLVNPQRIRLLMQLAATRVVSLHTEYGDADSMASISPDSIVRLYDPLNELDTGAAAHALQMLAIQSDDDSLEALVDRLVEAPPADWQSVGVALSPLWKENSGPLELFFELLGDGFLHPSTMAVLLDLANHALRSGRLEEHPWRERHTSLSDLLSNVLGRLRLLEQDPGKFGDSVQQVQQTLADSVALTVSLCDALGLIGNNDAVDPLAAALSVSHRRIQTEAAGALARLGNESGRNRVVELAEDRVARVRAVAYAEELGFADEIEDSLRHPQALAESELAGWLAEPDQFGIPPTDMEKIDSRSQYWPGYDEPRECYLFRFTYALPEAQVSNVGIAGPFAYAFSTDLANLPVDDIYAVFAGWQAEHDEIYEVPAAEWNQAQQREADRLTQSLADQDLIEIQPVALTFFFGEFALLALVEQQDKQLCAVTDGHELLCFPVSGSRQSFTPETILCMFRGRKLLRSFNV